VKTITLLLKLLEAAFDLWRQHRERKRILAELEAKSLRSAMRAKEKADAIDEAVRRLDPGAVPDGMRRYQRD
jgi:hypothetical protein